MNYWCSIYHLSLFVLQYLNRKTIEKKASNNLTSIEKDIAECAEALSQDTFLSFVNIADLIDKYTSIMDEREHSRSLIRRISINVLNTLILNGGTLTPTAIGKKVVRPTHTVTRIIDTLEKHGLVERDLTDSKDRRLRKVTITGKGVDVVKWNIAVNKKRILEPVFLTLSNKQKSELEGILNNLSDRLLSIIREAELGKNQNKEKS